MEFRLDRSHRRDELQCLLFFFTCFDPAERNKGKQRRFALQRWSVHMASCPTYVLEDPSSQNQITGVGDISIYGLDWTWIGTASCSTNLFTADASHNLLAGDTVYIAPLAGTTLTRGAYLVETAPTATTFKLHGVTLATGLLNYLAKVNSTTGAVPY